MAFARFVKKFVSPVAIMVTALMATAGVVPANAAAPAAANNLATSQVSSNWVIGSGNAATLANSAGMIWNAEYETRTTAWQGKTLSLAGSITPSITNASGNVSASLTYYKADGNLSSSYNYGNINSGGMGGDYQAVVPADAARIRRRR